MRRLVPRIWAGAWRASSMVARDAPVIPRPVCFRNARRLTSDGAAVLVRSSMPGSPRSCPDGERAERFGECRRRPARCQYSTAGLLLLLRKSPVDARPISGSRRQDAVALAFEEL